MNTAVTHRILFACLFLTLQAVAFSQRKPNLRLDISSGLSNGISVNAPASFMDDKSRVAAGTGITASSVNAFLYEVQQLVGSLAPEMWLFTLPEDKQGLIDGTQALLRFVEELEPVISQLLAGIDTLATRHSRLSPQKAIYPRLQWRVSSHTTMLLPEMSYSDYNLGIDGAIQFARTASQDTRAFGFALRMDLSPQRQAAARELLQLSQEKRRLDTPMHALSQTLSRFKRLLQQSKGNANSLLPDLLSLDPTQPNSPEKLQQLQQRYESLVATLRLSIEEVSDALSADGGVTHTFTPLLQQALDAARALYHLAFRFRMALFLTYQDFNQPLRVSQVGMSIGKLYRVGAEGSPGIRATLSASYLWASPVAAGEREGVICGVQIAWQDRTPVLLAQQSRWRWQAGVEYTFPSTLTNHSYGAFVRFRQPNHPADYSVFYLHRPTGADFLGVSLRYSIGLAFY